MDTFIYTYRVILLLCFTLGFSSVISHAQNPGCTDPLANNYDSEASTNDGSCTYDNVNIVTLQSEELPALLDGNSGLMLFRDSLVTFNDYGNPALHIFHPDHVNDYRTVDIPFTSNVDWEEITQDEEYIYIGDFGNNSSGDRTDLRIYRFKKSEFDDIQNVDTIKFSYELQTDFSPQTGNETNFDCEAFIVTENYIYLFTKEWLSKKTTLYRLDKTPGEQTAIAIDSLDVDGFISGVSHFQDKKLITLVGYNSFLQPFVYLLYDYQGEDFFAGNKRKININLIAHQVEGIASQDVLKYYISNEHFSFNNNDIPQKLHLIDLEPYLSFYFAPTSIEDLEQKNELNIYPNPSTDFIHFNLEKNNKKSLSIKIYDSQGRVIKEEKSIHKNNIISIQDLPLGLYYLEINQSGKQYTSPFIKN